MQQDHQPNYDGFFSEVEIDMEALRRDLEYVHAESDDYLAYELDTGQEAMAPTKEEALAKLKELAPDATRVFCDKIRLKVKAYELLPDEDGDI